MIESSQVREDKGHDDFNSKERENFKRRGYTNFREKGCGKFNQWRDNNFIVSTREKTSNVS